MLKKLLAIGTSVWYWAGLIVLGLSMETIALYYQYALNYLPCVLCIHVRIWVMGFIVVAAFALFVRKSWYLITTAHVLNTVMMVGLLERSWMTLGTERLTIIASCTEDSGLPAWFALDKWFPLLFKVHEPCGYTPELLFGITMAEGLMVLSTALVLISAVLTVSVLLESVKKRKG